MVELVNRIARLERICAALRAVYTSATERELFDAQQQLAEAVTQ